MVEVWYAGGTPGGVTHTNLYSTTLSAHYTFPANWRNYLKENNFNKGVKITQKLWYRGLQMTDGNGRYFYANLTLQEDSREGVWGVLDY